MVCFCCTAALVRPVIGIDFGTPSSSTTALRKVVEQHPAAKCFKSAFSGGRHFKERGHHLYLVSFVLRKSKSAIEVHLLAFFYELLSQLSNLTEQAPSLQY